ncbi:hypothetical protein [Streptomyces melanogenes]|uniref:Integral membrane protein n=2 Tax=Streptomyces melanogenes TaxID=67326 RepID=A0ABZ1XWR9_9ACTN|nr:hypothetical protein [Streptomyces melanogenes]
MTQLALVAEQFGYIYMDLHMNSEERYFTMLLLPDHSGHARARAAANWARYPHAADGRSLPPDEPEVRELLKARMLTDLGRQYSTRHRAVLALVPALLATLELWNEFGPENRTAGIVLASGSLVLFSALVLLGIAYARRDSTKYTRKLEAAGFTAVTDRNGRRRYYPPGRHLPGPDSLVFPGNGLRD